MENLRNSSNKSSNRKWKFSKFVPILAGALFLMNPNWVDAQNISNQSRAKVEVSTSTILDRLNQKIWVSLPTEYNSKVLNFVLNDTIMRTRSATAYTENFIMNEMKKDWWIGKQNQLLFIRSRIYAWISDKTLYDRLDDENESRSDEYSKALKQIAASYEEYKKWFKTYMDIKSAEAKQQSAKAKQQSAEAKQEAIQSISNSLEWIIIFYNSYKKNIDVVKQNEIDEAKKLAKNIITQCKEYWIDYKAILLKEVWDRRKVEEMLKFYDVE